MKDRRNRGFSLIELMIVLVIIAIFAVIAIPNLIENQKRNELTDLTNMVEQAASQTRNLVMQTRRAAVLEFKADEMWVNRLSGPNCWSGIDQRCTLNLGQKNSTPLVQVPFNLRDPDTYGDENGSFMCGVEVAKLNGAGDACEAAATTISPGASFALCYSGDGNLWFRDGDDAEAACTSSGTPVPKNQWVRSCVIIDSGDITFNGARIKFNRFDSSSSDVTGAFTDCADPSVMDVTRAVYIPYGGTPYSRVGGE